MYRCEGRWSLVRFLKLRTKLLCILLDKEYHKRHMLTLLVSTRRSLQGHNQIWSRVSHIVIGLHYASPTGALGETNAII